MPNGNLLGLILVLLILCCKIEFTSANDGVYFTNGGVIFPIHETDIQLKSEHLHFNCLQNEAEISIHFSFFNPSDKAKKVLVGFQAPLPGGGDFHFSEDEVKNINQFIKSFKILNRGEILPYQLKKAECKDCPLKDSKGEFTADDFNSEIVFVYLFEITFQPGENNIHHSYSMLAHNDIYTGWHYDYILTTGAKWAGSQIEDFTLSIAPGKNSFFRIADVFGTNADWSITGIGKIFNDRGEKRVRILNGQLMVKVKNFTPRSDISFSSIGVSGFFSPMFNQANLPDDVIHNLMYLSGHNLEHISPQHLRMMRNYIFATRGFRFQNRELLDFFRQFEWYIPDPNVTSDQIILNEREKEFIDAIRKAEK